ncbi:MAG: hypothetical protein QXF24_04125 [Thermoproteota archaeon]
MKKMVELIAGKKALLTRVACLVLLVAMVLPAFNLVGARGQEPADPTISTDEPEYAAGETVVFAVSGFEAGNYRIDISLKVDGELNLFASLDFTYDSDGMQVEWQIPYDAENGTYVAQVYAAGGDGEPLASVEFDVRSGAGERLGALAGELEGLEELVASSEIETAESLLASLSNCIAKVEAAVELLDEDGHAAANQLRAARNMLTAFVHKVLAQSGKSIGEDLAAELVERAFEYIQFIDSMIESTLVPLGKKLALNVGKTLAKQEMHMARFMVRVRLEECVTNEELLSLLNSTQAQLYRLLERARIRTRLMQGLLDNGTVDYQTLVMELEGSNDTVNFVKAVAELLSEELEELNQTRPGLGKHLGQFMKAAKALVGNCSELESSFGELASKGKSRGQGKGQQGGDNGGGQGKGKGKGGEGESNGGGDGGGGKDGGNGGGQGKGKGKGGEGESNGGGNGKQGRGSRKKE